MRGSDDDGDDGLAASAVAVGAVVGEDDDADADADVSFDGAVSSGRSGSSRLKALTRSPDSLSCSGILTSGSLPLISGRSGKPLPSPAGTARASGAVAPSAPSGIFLYGFSAEGASTAMCLPAKASPRGFASASGSSGLDGRSSRAGSFLVRSFGIALNSGVDRCFGPPVVCSPAFCFGSVFCSSSSLASEGKGVPKQALKPSSHVCSPPSSSVTVQLPAHAPPWVQQLGTPLPKPQVGQGAACARRHCRSILFLAAFFLLACASSLMTGFGDVAFGDVAFGDVALLCCSSCWLL